MHAQQLAAAATDAVAVRAQLRAATAGGNSGGGSADASAAKDAAQDADVAAVETPPPVDLAALRKRLQAAEAAEAALTKRLEAAGGA
jgi:hypothetical protein